MMLYQLEPRFNQRTGKPIEPVLTKTGVLICDYTGDLITTDDNDYYPQYELKADYDSRCEEVYYYDDARDFFESRSIEYGKLFVDPFVFSVNVDYTDKSVQLVQEWMLNINANSGVFCECKSIEHAMRIARVRTVKRLLSMDTYTIQQLGILCGGIF
jgi:hypothetical protein